MEQYGEFTQVINRLEDSLREVRTVWTDQTAITYDCINENMQNFAMQMWTCYTNCEEGYNAEKANYNQAEFDGIVNQLASKAAAV